MDRILDLTTGDVALFLLVFFRMAGVLMLAPVFGSASIPPAVKIFLSLVLAVLFFPLLERAGPAPAPQAGTFLVAVAKELGVGLLIGFTASLLFAAVQLGGQIIDQELGLMIGSVIDPVSNEQVSIVAQFKLFLAAIVYLLIDGHHFLVAAARDSLAAVPVAGLRFSNALAIGVADTAAGDVFRIGLQIAAPAMATLFLVTIAMAFMARTVPEMNVFILSFSLRVGVGLGVLAAGVGIFAAGFQVMNSSYAQAIRRLIERMGG